VTEKPNGLEENVIILYREGPKGSFHWKDVRQGLSEAIIIDVD